MVGELERLNALEHVTDYNSLLDFMRAVVIRFMANYEAVQAAVALAMSDSRSLAQVDERLKIHAEYVIDIPRQLGPAGIFLLTSDERAELFLSVGSATQALSSADEDGHYPSDAVFSILILGRTDGIKATLFER